MWKSPEELGFLTTFCADISLHVLTPEDQDPIFTVNFAVYPALTIVLKSLVACLFVLQTTNL